GVITLGTEPSGVTRIGIRRAPSANRLRNRCQSRGPAGPEITSYTARMIDSVESPSAARANGGVENNIKRNATARIDSIPPFRRQTDERPDPYARGSLGHGRLYVVQPSGARDVQVDPRRVFGELLEKHRCRHRTAVSAPYVRQV